ncbi:uncharacterized protein DEA37_0002860 [Paragonimus westermani]|uniref:ETS domain-containing protein n=1 Tax=Paragonimus westermani TaxID=34504 RepID=A0A5J4NUL2_9TREM|nr:uncharacterized protein DEA37_0002860 [Paragonimus westermani]
MEMGSPVNSILTETSTVEPLRYAYGSDKRLFDQRTPNKMSKRPTEINTSTNGPKRRRFDANPIDYDANSEEAISVSDSNKSYDGELSNGLHTELTSTNLNNSESLLVKEENNYVSYTDQSNMNEIENEEISELGTNGGKLTLWQFLLELLLSNKHTDMIRWTNKKGEFILLQAEGVAKLWGMRKDRNHRMNYDKLSRALRYYYEKNIIRKVHGHKFVYQFIGLRNLIKFCQSSVNEGSMLTTPHCCPSKNGLEQYVQPSDETVEHGVLPKSPTPFGSGRGEEDEERASCWSQVYQFQNLGREAAWRYPSDNTLHISPGTVNDPGCAVISETDVPGNPLSEPVPSLCPTDEYGEQVADNKSHQFNSQIPRFSFDALAAHTFLKRNPFAFRLLNSNSVFDSEQLAQLTHLLCSLTSVESWKHLVIPTSSMQFLDTSEQTQPKVNGEIDDPVSNQSHLQTTANTFKRIVSENPVPNIRLQQSDMSSSADIQVAQPPFHNSMATTTGQLCSPPTKRTLAPFLTNGLTSGLRFEPVIEPAFHDIPAEDKPDGLGQRTSRNSGPTTPDSRTDLSSVITGRRRETTSTAFQRLRPLSPNCQCSCHWSFRESIVEPDRATHNSKHASSHLDSLIYASIRQGLENECTQSSNETNKERRRIDNSPTRLHHERHAINMRRLGEQLSRLNRSVLCNTHVPVGTTTSCNSHPTPTRTSATTLGHEVTDVNLEFPCRNIHKDDRQDTIPLAHGNQSNPDSLPNLTDELLTTTDKQCVWMPVPVTMLTSWFHLLSAMSSSFETTVVRAPEDLKNRCGNNANFDSEANGQLSSPVKPGHSTANSQLIKPELLDTDSL